jgi:hypothetical protein
MLQDEQMIINKNLDEKRDSVKKVMPVFLVQAKGEDPRWWGCQ